MRDKVILGVTLSIVLLLTLVIYGVVDTQRAPTTAAVQKIRRCAAPAKARSPPVRPRAGNAHRPR